MQSYFWVWAIFYVKSHCLAAQEDRLCSFVADLWGGSRRPETSHKWSASSSTAGCQPAVELMLLRYIHTCNGITTTMYINMEQSFICEWILFLLWFVFWIMLLHLFNFFFIVTQFLFLSIHLEQLTNAPSRVEEAHPGRRRWCFLSNRDPPQTASAPSLFVISVCSFPWL